MSGEEPLRIPVGVVLLTGASGFLGRRVLGALAQRPGIRLLVATHRRDVGGGGVGVASYETVPMDLTGEVDVPRGIDTVIHVAGEKRDRRAYHPVNAAGARRLAQAACASGARRFVHVSTVGVYGAGRSAGNVGEDHVRRPGNAYEASKDEGERAVFETCSASGTLCVVLRPANVIGFEPGMHYPLLGLIRSVARGYFTWLGPGGDAWSNYVQVDDVAAAIVHAAQSPNAAGAYNVNCPAPLSDVVRWIAEELGLPEPRRRLPRWLGQVVAAGGSAVRAISRRGVPFDTERFRELTNRTRFDPGRLVDLTGFQYPVGAERMFRSLARTYRDTNLA